MPPPEYEACPDIEKSESIAVEGDGRIKVDVQSALFQTLSRAIAHEVPEQEQQTLPPPPAYTPFRHPNLKLNIVIQVVGSRGDVQPFLALAVELATKHGHRVRLATHDVFADFVRREACGAAVEFFPIGGDPAALMAYMVRNPGLLPSMATLRGGEIARKRLMVGEMLRGCWASCVEPDPVTGAPFVADAIIANPPSFAYVHCAQALGGVPVHVMFTMPWTSTRAFPHPLANMARRRGEGSKDDEPAVEGAGVVGVQNYASYLAVEHLQWQGLGDLINAWRHTLDLEPISSSEGPRLAETLRIPFTYCWSPALVPKPRDWPAHVGICGFFFREPPQYSPPPELQAFLAGGAPPVYIGFGSIVIDDPDKLTATILQAVRRTGTRAIVSRGWSNLGSNLGEEQDDENVLFLGDCPHEWLFQHVSAVVHHGGAGTTACGLANGRPTAIVPFFGDQPFWGAMVASSGAGPPPIPQRQLDSANLAEAVRFCLRDSTVLAAQKLAERMRHETGVRTAVDLFHASIPAPDEMRCDILSDRAAAWVFSSSSDKKGGKKKKIKLCKLAAEILVDEGVVPADKLRRFETKPMVIETKRWDPVTGTTSSLIGTFKGMTMSATDIVVQPALVYHEHRKQQQRRSNIDPGLPCHREDNNTDSFSHKNNDKNSTSKTTSRRPSQDSKHQPQHPLQPPTNVSPNAPTQKPNLALAMTASAAAGVGGFFHHFAKGMYIDMPLAATEGLRALPGLLHGEAVPDLDPVTGWKSGMLAAGRNFCDGVGGGLADFVREPVKGARREGVLLGGMKGVGKGSVNLVAKTSSGLLGLVAYPGQGIFRSISTAINSATAKQIHQSRRAEGRWILGREEMASDQVCHHVLREFDRLA
ncbi:UDP-glucose,sterol transferase [Microdochium bolleyi]|uniref:UDP-glucose,sterol transferase n=1 Tax=Microdochium bolleyi TaxID=196109 RepID=A0A136J3P8_9PEZI|nr:UDP-glucose,sterol transferase [Microdochium bolleyi]